MVSLQSGHSRLLQHVNGTRRLQFLHAGVNALFAEEMETMLDHEWVAHYVHADAARKMLYHLLDRHQRHLTQVKGQLLDEAGCCWNLSDNFVVELLIVFIDNIALTEISGLSALLIRPHLIDIGLLWYDRAKGHRWPRRLGVKVELLQKLMPVLSEEVHPTFSSLFIDY
jgi:hypothetical protein